MTNIDRYFWGFFIIVAIILIGSDVIESKKIDAEVAKQQCSPVCVIPAGIEPPEILNLEDGRCFRLVRIDSASGDVVYRKRTFFKDTK